MIIVWWELMRDHSLEFAAAFLALYGIWRLFDRSVSAQWGYLLFLILGLKLVLPGVVSLPLLPEIRPAFVSMPALPAAGEKKAVLIERESGEEVHAVSRPRPASDSAGRSLAPAVPAARAPVSLPAVLFWFWAGGVLLLTAREVWNHVRLRSLARRCPLLRSEDIGLDLNALAWQACVDRPVRWIAADWARSPMTYGVWNPVVVVPTALEQKVPKTQLRWILMHELAHIRRGDYLVYLLQRLIGILYFFHPLVWWNHHLLNALREYACDEEATAKSTSSVRDCCEGLLSIAALRSGIWSPASPVSAVVHSETFLRRRLMKILQPQTNRIMNWIAWPVLSVCLLSLLVFSVGDVVTASSQDQEPAVAVPVPIPVPVEAPAPVPVPEAKASAELAGLKEKMGDGETVVVESDIPVENHSGFGVEIVEGTVWMKGVPAQGDTPISLLVTCEVLNQLGSPVDESVRNEVMKKILVEEGRKTDDKQIQRRIRYAEGMPEGVNVTLYVRALVPSSLNVSANSEDGDMQLEDFDGNVSAQMADGDLAVQNCRGEVTANSGDGDMSILNIGGKLTAQTGDGDLAIQNCQGAVQAMTGDGDLAILNIGGAVTTQTGDGDVAVQNCEQSVETMLGDGDINILSCQGAVKITSGEGDITLENCRGSVDSTSGGGDVVMKSVEGPVSTQTGEGDLVLEEIGDCRKLVTQEGDIVLTLSKAPANALTCQTGEGDLVVSLPKGSPVTLAATVSSEGEIDLQETDAFQGLREEQTVKGTLNGGGSPVTLQVESGSIVIQSK